MSMMTFLSMIYSSFTSMSQIFQHLCRSDTATLVAQKWSQTLDKNLSTHFDRFPRLFIHIGAITNISADSVLRLFELT